MLLQEFMYFDRHSSGMNDDLRYKSEKDTSVLGTGDVRKTRLTLKMLNDLRRASDAREIERKDELALIRKMYATPPPEEAAM
jgi:hypothetical protein